MSAGDPADPDLEGCHLCWLSIRHAQGSALDLVLSMAMALGAFAAQGLPCTLCDPHRELASKTLGDLHDQIEAAAPKEKKAIDA